MRASEMVRELLRVPLRQVTPADSADTRTPPSSPALRTAADSCGRFHENRNVRKHPQASAILQTRAQPSYPQDPQVPQPTGSEITSEPDPEPGQQTLGKVLYLRRTVTCATCMHQQRRPDTSEAGMHGCDRGHRLHYAREQHACADWKAQP